MMYGNYGPDYRQVEAAMKDELVYRPESKINLGSFAPVSKRIVGFYFDPFTPVGGGAWGLAKADYIWLGITFGANPLIVKHFRPRASYKKRVAIGFAADVIAGLIAGMLI